MATMPTIDVTLMMLEVEVLYAPGFGGWLVSWFGTIHGGVHYDRGDAEQHAQALRDAEGWDRDGWRAKYA